MNKMPLVIFAILILQACSSEPEYPYARIQDAAEILEPEQEAALDSIFELHEAQYPHRLAIATVLDFEGKTIYQWSQEKMTSMNLNDSGDQSVLFVLNPVSREVRIEVSAALQQKLPERITIQVADKSILPELKRINYYRGLFLGASGITSWLKAAENNQTP